MNILCYCEANSRTGFGHFSRIRILINIIKKKFPKSKITIFSENIIEAKKFFQKEIIFSKSIYKYILHNKDLYNLIILDPPYYENNKDKEMGKELKKIFYIRNKKFKILKLTDETKPSKHFCDYLINDYPLSINFKETYKEPNKKIILFLGLYAFLYSDIILKKTVKKKKYDLLIVFGGKDPNNLGDRYFKILNKIKLKKIFILNNALYKKYIKKKDTYNIIKPVKGQKEFLKILNESKMYISTPSNIMFEAYSLNIPGIVIPTQNRQNIMGQTFQKMKIVKSLPIFTKLKEDMVKKELKILKNIKLKFNIKKAIQMQNRIIKNL